ncbi:MAG: hypothetical protein L0228_02005 [Planctomycetes bacterium]|nr:hypothetical protein [Planctomycetota bacterium]
MSQRIKPDSPPLPVLLRRLLFRPRVWAGLVFLLGLGVGAHFLWQRGAPTIARHPQYQLAAESIHITPPPAWIRSDLKSQVIRDAGLTALSVLDDWDTLSRRVKDAFEFHPWVSSVERITKRLPAALDIELTYRRPVAAVESRDSSGISFLPVDERAIRLPEGDLTDIELRYLPRISGVTGRPLVGDTWNDLRVVGGAKLAAALGDVWQKLRLVEIIATIQAAGADDSQSCSFDIITTGGMKVVWGTAPGQETSAGESTFDQKRKRLLDYAAQHGQFESIDGPAAIDVRNDLVVTPRTARKKSATKSK